MKNVLTGSRLGKYRLLQFEDKNGDGRIQYYNDGNAEFAAKAEAEYGWKGNEMVKVDRDIMVLANLKSRSCRTG